MTTQKYAKIKMYAQLIKKEIGNCAISGISKNIWYICRYFLSEYS